jgi:tripartite ATP-independent transporter DctP family solute receptor
MMKARFICILMASILVVFFGVGSLAWAEPIQLKINTISATGSDWHKAMLKFAETVKAKTNGKYEVLVYADGQLGNIPQTLSGMQLGSIDMGYFGLGSALYLKEARAMHVMYVPYLFKDKAQATRILNDPIFTDIYKDLAQKTGIRIFGAFGARSPRSIQTTRGPIMKPADLQGMKLRIPGIDIFLNTFRALGVKPTALPMTEIYMGLKQGVIEGQDNGFDLAMPLKFHEVAKYWSATDHAYEVTGWFISEKVWQKFTSQEKTVFVEAAREAGALTTELTAKLDEASIETIKQIGGTYVVPDREAFQKALAHVHDPLEGKYWPKGLVAKIKAMQEF